MAEIELKSDVIGRVWQIPKTADDRVEAEEAVIIIESMKMEIPVAPEQAGRVVRILVAEGDEVEEDQPVAIFAPD